MKDDDVPCVVLTREHKGQEWELAYRTLRKSVAWRSAYEIRMQEQLLAGSKRPQTLVVKADDWDQKKIIPLTPPAGFEELAEEENAATAIRQQELDKARAAAKLLPPPVPMSRPVRELAKVGPLIEPAPKTQELIYTDLEL